MESPPVRVRRHRDDSRYVIIWEGHLWIGGSLLLLGGVFFGLILGLVLGSLL